jgi:NADPH:quinone reductase-like Zn-dependent oxidoreductase
VQKNAGRPKVLGASDVINHRETLDWDEQVRVLIDGRGVDCVVEIGGGRPWANFEAMNRAITLHRCTGLIPARTLKFHFNPARAA